MTKLNKVTLKEAEAAVLSIQRKTPVLESLFKKETPIQVLSYKYGKIFKTRFFYWTPPLILNAHSFCMILPQFAL